MNQAVTIGPSTYSARQQLFVRFFVAVLIDLTVLNLFAEYWPYVIIESFTTSLLTAALLQTLFGVTLRIERGVAGFFLRRGGATAMTKALISIWIVAFGVKVAALHIIDILFGEQLLFVGPYAGTLAFLVVVFTMLLVERFVRRVFVALG